MRITILTDEECYAHLNQPFNPPVMSVGYGEEAFSNEWHQANDGLKRILERHGESDDYGEKDYVIGDTLMLSRGIGVEVTSDRLLNKMLLPDTHEFLCSLDQEYEIDFAIDSTEGIFHVFVSRDSVKTNCPTALIDRL